MKDIYVILILCLICFIGIANGIWIKDIRYKLINIENIIKEYNDNEGEQNE